MGRDGKVAGGEEEEDGKDDVGMGVEREGEKKVEDWGEWEFERWISTKPSQRNKKNTNP